jgi:prophage regulatory protein
MKLLAFSALKDKGITHSDVQIWRMAKVGLFPRPVKIGNKNAWIESEIDAWIAERIQERDAVA